MNKLREERKKQNLTQREMADKVGLSFKTYCRYEMGEREPRMSDLLKIAEILGVSVEYLSGKEETQQSIFGAEPKMSEPTLPEGAEPLIRVPILSDEASVCCGFGNEIADTAQVEDWAFVTPKRLGTIEADRPPFAITASGDSMIGAGIYYDSVLIINPALEPRRGDVVVVDYYGRRMARYYMPCQNGLDLSPANSRYKTLHLTPEEIDPSSGIYHFLGVVKITQTPTHPME